MKMARFAGKVALVTGAASGIGAATAARLAAEGAAVVATDRNVAGVAEICARLEDPARHLALAQDVTREADWAAVLERIEAAFGRLDVLVNNAGWSRSARIAEMQLADWRAAMAVHCDAAFLGIRHAMPLLARTAGSIVNLSSVRAYVARPGAAAYCAAKAAVTMLTKAAALECAEAGHGVRVNSVHPGYVRTALSAGAAPEVLRAVAAEVPAKRLAEPAEIAAVIAFLASEDAAYMNGSELVVDGALTAK